MSDATLQFADLVSCLRQSFYTLNLGLKRTFRGLEDTAALFGDWPRRPVARREFESLLRIGLVLFLR